MYGLLFFLTVSLFSKERLIWDGEALGDYHEEPISRHITEPSVLFRVKHIQTYGHALLDGVFPFYLRLKEKNLLETPFVIVLKMDPELQAHPGVQNIFQLLSDLFPVQRIHFLEKGDLLEHPLMTAQEMSADSSFFQACPEAHEYMSLLCSFGLQEDVIFRDPHPRCTQVSDFVEFVKGKYHITSQMQSKRILIASRIGNRKIKNLKKVVKALRKAGYQVVVRNFETMSMRDQIQETAKARYLIGTYGSNLTNAIFLDPKASVVVLWHKYTKYFWSRRYCLLHGAFLSRGVELMEWDKKVYDPCDAYLAEYTHPEYFSKSGNMYRLREEKESLEAMLQFPDDVAGEITFVDLHIDPQELVEVLKRKK